MYDSFYESAHINVQNVRSFFRLLPPQDKLLLNSGVFLEDVIAEYVEKFPKFHMGLYGIIDLEDEFVKRMLQPSDVADLKTKVPQLPELDPKSSFIKALTSFEGCK